MGIKRPRVSDDDVVQNKTGSSSSSGEVVDLRPGIKTWISYFEENLRNKPEVEWSDEDLLLSTIEFQHNWISQKQGLIQMPILRRYLNQLECSEGFDIDGPVPEIGLPEGAVFPVEDVTSDHKKQKYFKYLASLAIQSYNLQEKTDFEALQVEKVNSNPYAWVSYYLTFTAKDASPRKRYRSPKTFQARVAIRPPTKDSEGGPEVDFCRLKRKDV